VVQVDLDNLVEKVHQVEVLEVIEILIILKVQVEEEVLKVL
jgi:hypothetical protein